LNRYLVCVPWFLSLWICSFCDETEGGQAAVPVHGLVLTDSMELVIPRDEGVHCFNLFLSEVEEKKLVASLEKISKGQDLSVEFCQEVKEEITQFYEKQGRPFVQVRIPEQEITDGVMVVNVQESRLGKVSIEGARWFPSDWYRSSIRSEEGMPLKVAQLQEDVSWMDRNPFRSVDVICKPGTRSGATDVDLLVKDLRPVKATVGTDNTGFKDDGYQRAFASLCIGNLFSLGQVFSYQYTTDYDFKLFQSHTASYEIPCFWRHLVSFFGGISFVRTPLESTGKMRSHGDSFQGSTRYTIPFAQGTRVPQEIRFGCDFKRMNNNVIFGGQTVTSKNVDLFQFLLEYKLFAATPNITHQFSVEAVLSPGPLLPNMNSADFDLLRPGAGPNYFYLRGALKETFRLPYRFSIDLDFAFQLSTKKLLASEQFGLGGYSSVRGYQERAVNADNAVLLRLEPRFPSISLPKKAGTLSFFLFSDVGVGIDQLKLASDYRTSQVLVGVGPGFRYHYKNNIFMRFDWGYQLTNIQNNPAGHNRINFGASFSL
jgi:hemolysin activation/secretion protein